jgi:hypothetical protein
MRKRVRFVPKTEVELRASAIVQGRRRPAALRLTPMYS